MSSTRPYFPLGLSLVLACSGCTIPTFTNPLVNPSDAKSFPELHGVYRTTDCPDNLVMYAHVGPAGDAYPEGFFRIIWVGQPKNAETALHSSSYLGFVEQIGRYFILHIPLAKSPKLDKAQDIWNERWDVKQVCGYMVVRLSVRDDGVEMASLNNELVAEMILAKELAGEVTQEYVERNGIVEIGKKTIAITADTKDLRAFFTRHIDGKLFSDPDWKYTRVD